MLKDRQKIPERKCILSWARVCCPRLATVLFSFPYGMEAPCWGMWWLFVCTDCTQVPPFQVLSVGWYFPQHVKLRYLMTSRHSEDFWKSKGSHLGAVHSQHPNNFLITISCLKFQWISQVSSKQNCLTRCAHNAARPRHRQA